MSIELSTKYKSSVRKPSRLRHVRRFGLIFIALGLAAFLIPQAYWYSQAQGLVPPGVLLGGLEVGNSQATEIDQALQYTFRQPVAVYFDDERLIFQPDDVSFRVKTNEMLTEAVAQGQGLGRWRGFVYHVLGQPTPAITVPLQYEFDSNALITWLNDAAAKHDHPPEPAHALPLESGRVPTNTLPFEPGKPGLQLAIKESIPNVLAALASPTQREAHLVLIETPAPPPNMNALAELLDARARQWPGVASVYVQEVATGEEAAVNADVAFAGMSTMKIPILAEVFRKLDAPPDLETHKLLTETLGLSGNFSANLLLRVVGDGSAQKGADVLTGSMRQLKLVNTFMATPYDVESQSFRITTPANSRTDVTTQPDIHMQTTARDMGTLAAMIVSCSQGNGNLLAAYAPKITAEECLKMIEYMKLNHLEALISAGLPPGTTLAHKHGYINDSHADVAMIWGPTGPYILAIYIYMPKWVLWDYSNGFMSEVSRATWQYFEWKAQQEKK